MASSCRDKNRLCKRAFTAPFNNMRTLTLKAQPTNVFFVNQMSIGSSQLSTAERGNQIVERSSDKMKQCSAVVGSWEEPPNIIFGIYLIIIMPTKKE